MSDSNFSAIRARLRYESIEEFIDGYARFISAGGMFIPMAPNKLKPIGTTIRFQFLLTDASTALLGEGVVVQVRPPDEQNSRAPVGMLVKFSKLSQESKNLVDQIVAMKETGAFASASDASFDEEDAEAQAESGSAAEEPEDDVYERTHEMKLENFLAMDSASRPDEPATAETPTAEAPEEPATREAPVDEPGAGPRKLGQTAGGLQILAFDDISDEEAQAMDFDLGAEESDIDEMFAGLFGGGDDGEAAGDPFGGSFGGGEGAPEGESSMEFELPEEEQFAALEAEPAIEAEPAFEAEIAEPQPVSEPHISEPELSEPHVSEPHISEPEVSEPEVSEPELSVPEVSVPEVSEPHVSEPHISEPEVSEPELSEPHVSEPELSEPHVSEPELSEPHVSEPELSEPHVSEPELSEPHVSEPEPGAEPELSEPHEDHESGDELAAAEALLAAESDQASDDDGYEFDIVASARDLDPAPATQDIDEEAIEEVVEAAAPADAEPAEDELGESDSQSLELDSDAVELIEGSEMEELLEEEEGEEPEPPGFQVDEDRSSELENLLGNLESAPQHDDPSSLTLASSPDIVVDDVPAPEPEPEDENSLEFLLGLARHEIDSKHSDEKSSDDRDILDDLLGDDAGLPPPPSDTPVFNPTRPPTGKEKKGGFLSKLFGKD